MVITVCSEKLGKDVAQGLQVHFVTLKSDMTLRGLSQDCISQTLEMHLKISTEVSAVFCSAYEANLSSFQMLCKSRVLESVKF